MMKTYNKGNWQKHQVRRVKLGEQVYIIPKLLDSQKFVRGAKKLVEKKQGRQKYGADREV